MYNPNKFNYVRINKETINGSRKYATPDGEKLPSVTTILEATKSEESKKALMEWRNRVGHKKAQEITTEAAGRGTRMHKFIEDYIKTGILNEPGSNPYSIQSQKMAKSIIEKGLCKLNEAWGVEVPLYFPKMYAGTTDLCGVHDGAEAIMDHKQSNKVKKREWIDDYFIQSAAYATAHNEAYGTNIRKGVIFMCTADNQYLEFIIEGNEFDSYTDKWFQRVEQYYMKFL
jgi:genome maintenance exonuclease 1